MTSKCGKNKIVAHEAIAECVTDVLSIFWRLLWLLLNRRTATWNLFVLYNKETNYHRKNLIYFKIFQHDSKASPAHIDKHEKKSFDVIHCLYKWSNLIDCHTKRIFIGPRKSRHCQTWLERCSSWNENLQRKQNWTAKSTNLEENAGKIETVFVIRAALWAE